MIIDESFILLLKVGTWPAPPGFYGECRFHYMNNNWKFLSHTEGYVHMHELHIMYTDIYIYIAIMYCKNIGFDCAIFVHVVQWLDLVESPLFTHSNVYVKSSKIIMLAE